MSVSRNGHRAAVGTLKRESGFTVVELGVVVVIIGIMLGATMISYWSATRRTEVMGAAEQIKQELRRVYALTDSGEKTNGVPTAARNRYRITFNNNGEDPPNAYMVERGTSNDGGATYSYVPMVPARGASNKIVATNWVQPSSSRDCQLVYSAKTLTYMSRGSILQVSPAADNTITVTSASVGRNVVITVNSYGNVN
ncbi:MAG: hypothetical protein ACYC99_08165 [Candidatus Geothermincolia bacterium]